MSNTKHFLHGDSAVRMVLEKRRERSLLGFTLANALEQSASKSPERQPVVRLNNPQERRATFPLAVPSRSPTRSDGSSPSPGLEPLRASRNPLNGSQNASEAQNSSPLKGPPSGPNPYFTAEVRDTLATSLVALKQWTLLHHPATSVAFARKIVGFCDKVSSAGASVKGTLRPIKSRPTKRDDAPANDTPSAGTLFLNDNTTEQVDEQGFAIALTPLYHIPTPSIHLKTIRVSCNAFGLANEKATWSDSKRRALLDLVGGLKSVIRIEIEDGEDGLLAIEGVPQVLNNSVHVDWDMIGNNVVPMLAANRKLAKKMTKKHLAEVKRSADAQNAEEVKLLTRDLSDRFDSEHRAIVVEEAKARHKLAAACQMHKSGSRRVQQKRMLIDRFILEQSKLMRVEEVMRGDLVVEEMAAIRKHVWRVCSGTVELLLAPHEIRERKSIRDAYYLEGYEIRKHLNDVYERKRADREEFSDFEQRMRQLILTDEIERSEIVQKGHLAAMKILRLHNFATVRHLERMQAIANGAYEMPSIVSTSASPRDPEDSRRGFPSGARTPVSARSRSTVGSL